MSIDFHAPSRHGDILEFRLRPTRVGRSSVGLAIEAYCGEEKRLSVTSTLVFARKGAIGSESWPEAMVSGLMEDEALVEIEATAVISPHGGVRL